MKNEVLGWTAYLLGGFLLVLAMVSGALALRAYQPEPMQYWQQPDGRLIEIHEPYTGSLA